MSAQYPNVAVAPGVPPVLRRIGNAQNTVVLLAADAVSVINLFSGPRWGLFTKGGQPAFQSASTGIIATVLNALSAGGQSIGGLEYRQDNRISTAPQEKGAFLSYNKVALPWDARVTYIVGGFEAARNSFTAAVLGAQASLQLYDLVMPEHTYPDCNVVHHDFRRTARNGVSMFAVDVWVEQVRVTGAAAFSKTATPAGAANQNNGTAQTYTPTPEQASMIGESVH